MRYFLLMIAVVTGQSVLAADKEVLITNPFVEEAIGKKLKKPYGKFAPPMKLTKAELAKVTRLNLGYTQITDAGLKEVAKLQKLRRLDLPYTQITDTGLRELAKMKQLRSLDLAKCSKITEKDVVELMKAMPNCKISGNRCPFT